MNSYYSWQDPESWIGTRAPTLNTFSAFGADMCGVGPPGDHLLLLQRKPKTPGSMTLVHHCAYLAGPFIVRVGGGSTDSTKDLLPQGVYKALKNLHKETGVKYILGINFEDLDQKLTQGQMQRARRSLPADALLSFELGNEVRGGHFHQGGS